MDFIKEQNRIYAENNQKKAIAEVTFYEIEDGVYNIDHTFVDEDLRGEGIGSKLVEEAVDFIKSKGCKAKATCPFATKWMEKHN